MNALSLPRAAAPFVGFPAILRAHGFGVSPDQTIGFLEAVTLLGPRHINDIRRAGVAMLAIPKDREEEYDALFRAFFLGMTVPGVEETEDEAVSAFEPTGAEENQETFEPDDDPGEEAASLERLTRRDFDTQDPAQALSQFERLAPTRLPRRRSHRFAAAQNGRLLDMRRTLRDAAKRDGEVFTLAKRKRKDRQRKTVLLIDVSGSMKERTQDALTLAHALTRTAERVEVFTLGTRLTRVTPALRLRNRTQALARASAVIADVDGGTRIGEALTAFLDIPRYAGFARGAAVVVLSDGLERGTPDAMIDATKRLSRLAWRLDWLSPLAADPDYIPATGGMAAIITHLDTLTDGSNTQAVIAHILHLASHPNQQNQILTKTSRRIHRLDQGESNGAHHPRS